MKNILYKNIRFLFGMLLLITTFISCVKDRELSITEPARYTSADVKSYADLFKVFWTVMDQRYAYFFEQYRKDSMDWNTVYKEYYPKFEALKTWWKSPGVTEDDINKDTEQAKKYFEDIIDPIIDKHFFVVITMPYGDNATKYTFYGGVKNPKQPNVNIFTRTYMKDRLTGDTMEHSILLAGNLASNPDIYYFGLKNFQLFPNFSLSLNESYLSPHSGINYTLTAAEIDANAELNAIQDSDARERARNFTKDLLNNWNAFFALSEVKTFNDNVSRFNSTENVSEAFLDVTQVLLDSLNRLMPYDNANTYSSVRTNETKKYLDWFMTRMNDHVQKVYELSSFKTAAAAIINKGPFYKKILNPLTKGNIKKMIIDLRGNGGGKALDLAYFASRLVTYQTIFGYQRLKEGNGQFNYTPWTPMYANPHPFSIPSKIPIAILTDNGSASTSEIATMVLKSQGEHVISIGDYTLGATAALADSDDFNAGTRETIAGGYLKFYMPVMAVKDWNEVLVEGVGVKPDIYEEPLSLAEIFEIRFRPDAFKDRVLDQAVKFLSQ